MNTGRKMQQTEHILNIAEYSYREAKPMEIVTGPRVEAYKDKPSMDRSSKDVEKMAMNSSHLTLAAVKIKNRKQTHGKRRAEKTPVSKLSTGRNSSLK